MLHVKRFVLSLNIRLFRLVLWTSALCVCMCARVHVCVSVCVCMCWEKFDHRFQKSRIISKQNKTNKQTSSFQCFFLSISLSFQLSDSVAHVFVLFEFFLFLFWFCWIDGFLLLNLYFLAYVAYKTNSSFCFPRVQMHERAHARAHVYMVLWLFFSWFKKKNSTRIIHKNDTEFGEFLLFPPKHPGCLLLVSTQKSQSFFYREKLHENIHPSIHHIHSQSLDHLKCLNSINKKMRKTREFRSKVKYTFTHILHK